MAFRGAPTWPGLSRRHCTYHRLQRLLALLHDHGQGEHEDLRLFRGSWILCWDDIGLELCAGWARASVSTQLAPCISGDQVLHLMDLLR